jgi:hypothetical protein
MSRRTKIDNDRARVFQAKTIRRGNSPINFTIPQLINYSQTPFFIDMICYHRWMENIYTGNHVQNERLMFIRKWWVANIPTYKFVKEGKSVKFEQQLKLF